MAKTKKDIDKEIMYNKIMPTSLRGAAQQLYEDTVDKEALERPRAAETARAKNPLAPSPVCIGDSSSAVLINVMEHLVLSKLDSAISKFNCCRCDKCKKDIAAIALNKLSPKYIVTNENELVFNIEKYYSTEVTTALVQAILQVRTKPRH